ncbi:NAD-dependent epimerase [Planctomicrobium sp. SH661]|uniref:NAD-dependent epimerase n=1 Tax=Planctomicrobium sp. SH661 TaxID=3448124 RepID=UPI003F5C396D
MKILVTGAAGFIGFHVCRSLLERGDQVVGIDNFNDYYDVQLKRDRIALIERQERFKIIEGDLSHPSTVTELFSQGPFDRVIHLAAQAGVRYSLVNPKAYIDSNLVAFSNVLEACRHNAVPHLVYASSSSVYGASRSLPYSVHQNVDHPLSLYAATKKANELMAHTYSHLFRIPTTGLRFFTVYGPWGRPDMAVFLFTKAILEGKSIDVFNQGQMQRDMTYIDDIVRGVVLTSDRIPEPNPNWSGEHPDPGTSSAPFRLYNIGNHQPVPLLKLIETVEACLGKTAQKRFLEMQPGDVPATFADVEDLRRDVGFQPDTPIELGVRRFVEWYCEYRGLPLPSADR